MQHETDRIPVLSIVCPAFQEEEVLPLFHLELSTALAALEQPYDVEIVYVDDGSSDATLEVMRELALADERVRYLSLSRNFGHQAALTAGLAEARGDVVVSMDADLQHPPALLVELLSKWRQGADIVLTIREDDPQLSLFKRVTSRWFYRVMKLAGETDIRMAAADYRLMSRRAVDALLQLRETHRFLRGMVQWLGFPVAEIGYRPARRKAGVSKYSIHKMLSLAVDGILSFSRLPLRLALMLGAIALVAGLGLGCWAAVSLFSAGASGTAGLALVLASRHALGGSILICLGIVG